MEKCGATVIASGVEDLPRSGSVCLRKFQYLKSYQNTRCVPKKGTMTLPERPKPYCRLPPKTGMCRAAVPSWYYIYNIYYILYTINYIYIYLSSFLVLRLKERKVQAVHLGRMWGEREQVQNKKGLQASLWIYCNYRQ